MDVRASGADDALGRSQASARPSRASREKIRRVGVLGSARGFLTQNDIICYSKEEATLTTVWRWHRGPGHVRDEVATEGVGGEGAEGPRVTSGLAGAAG